MPKDIQKYVHSFQQHNLNAPEAIVPFLIEKFNPKSVVDVGCGLGTFLHVFQNYGVVEVLGIDGSWVDKSKLFISEKNFLEKNIEKKISIKNRFDLVLCLEVAEHLKEESADILVDNLTSFGNIIIFSAAIKNQGGQNHINEQPFEYWINKFKNKGFVFYDVFRNYFWNNSSVNWWYRQNMFLVLHQYINISLFFPLFSDNEILEYVHPQLLEANVKHINKLKEKQQKIVDGNADWQLYMNMIIKKFKNKFF